MSPRTTTVLLSTLSLLLIGTAVFTTMGGAANRTVRPPYRAAASVPSATPVVVSTAPVLPVPPVETPVSAGDVGRGTPIVRSVETARLSPFLLHALLGVLGISLER